MHEGSASNSPPLAEMGWLSPLRLREDDTPAGSLKNFTLARAMESLLEQVLEFSRSYFAESRSLPVPPVAGQEVEDSNFISARSAPGVGGAGGPTMAADSLPGWDGYGECPTRELANNAGLEGSVVVEEVKRRNGNEGYNVSTGEYEDLVKAGVVDPKKVTRTALQNAASVAGLLLTTECLVTEVKEKEKAKAPPGGGGGGEDMDY